MPKGFWVFVVVLSFLAGAGLGFGVLPVIALGAVAAGMTYFRAHPEQGWDTPGDGGVDAVIMLALAMAGFVAGVPASVGASLRWRRERARRLS